MIFEFYWSWYEEYSPTILEGPEKTEDEFTSDCEKAMIETFDSYMEKENGWASLSSWVKVATIKLEDYGYKIIRPISCGYFGVYLLKEEEHIDEEEKALPQFSEQIKKMKRYNTEFDKDLYKDKKEEDKKDEIQE